MSAQISSLLLDWKIYTNRLMNAFTALSVITGVITGVLVVLFAQPLYTLLLLASLIVFFTTIFSVQFGLLALVFIVYTRSSDIIVHNYDLPSLTQPFVALLAIAILIRWALFRETPIGWQKTAVLLGLYGLIGFSSILYAETLEPVMDALTAYGKDAIIAIMVVILLKNAASFRRVIWVLISIGLFLGTLSTYQFMTGSFTNDFGGFANADYMQILDETNDYRIGGPVGDPNFFAQILVVIVPLALGRMMSEQAVARRLLALASLVVMVLSIMFTYSRGGFLALGVTLALYFIVYPPRRAGILIIILIFGTGLLFAPSNYFDRILSLNQIYSSSSPMNPDDASLNTRVTQNLVAWEMIKANPLFGVGLHNYSAVYTDYAKALGRAISTEGSAAHNLYFEVLAETGTLGFAIFAVIIWASFSAVWKARKIFLQIHLSDYAVLVTSFAIGLTGYLVAAMFIHGAYPRYFYLLIGIAMALQNVTRHTLETSNNEKRSA
jgi:putative inorganic carbon (hco3(-)) transporter